jgi:hypothetical protein
MVEPGRIIGAYVIEARAGVGGMAEVWRVRHRTLGSLHALKILRPELAADAELRGRFLAEGRVQAQVRHPNIAVVTDVVVDEGVAALVMELLLGGTLEGRVSEGPLPWRTAVELLAPVCEAVDLLHARGVVHRDLKSSNLIFRDVARTVLAVSDFGVARVEDGALEGGRSHRTRTGHLLGTPAYMSPEQVRGRQVDGRSDVFSLGVVAWEMLVAALPFEQESDFETMSAIVDGRRRRLAEVLPEGPPALIAAVERALVVDPADRWPSALAFGEALREAARAPAVVPGPPPFTPPVSAGAPRVRLAPVARPVAERDEVTAEVPEPAAEPKAYDGWSAEEIAARSAAMRAAELRSAGGAVSGGTDGRAAALAGAAGGSAADSPERRAAEVRSAGGGAHVPHTADPRRAAAGGSTEAGPARGASFKEPVDREPTGPQGAGWSAEEIAARSASMRAIAKEPKTPAAPRRWGCLRVLLGCGGLVTLVAAVLLFFLVQQESQRDAARDEARAVMVALKRYKTDPVLNKDDTQLDMLATRAQEAVDTAPVAAALGTRALVEAWRQRWHHANVKLDPAELERVAALVREAEHAGGTGPSGAAAVLVAMARCRFGDDPTPACERLQLDTRQALARLGGADDGWLREEVRWAAVLGARAEAERRLQAGDTMAGRAWLDRGVAHCVDGVPNLGDAPVNGRYLLQSCVMLAGWLGDWESYLTWADRLVGLSAVPDGDRLMAVYRGAAWPCTTPEVGLKWGADGRPSEWKQKGTGGWGDLCVWAGRVAEGCGAPAGDKRPQDCQLQPDIWPWNPPNRVCTPREAPGVPWDDAERAVDATDRLRSARCSWKASPR